MAYLNSSLAAAYFELTKIYNSGQGAQWSQMGKEILQFFPWTRLILEELDAVLQKLPEPPTWSLIGMEKTPPS